jgi:hypothetical protein
MINTKYFLILFIGYFYARNHNVLTDGKISLIEYKQKLLERIKMYKMLFDF